MIYIPIQFSELYGCMAFSTVAIHRDANLFEIKTEDISDYILSGAEGVRDLAEENREMSLIRPWVEYMITCTNEDLRDFDFCGIRQMYVEDVLAPLMGLSGIEIDEWHFLLQELRHALFGLPPMTDEEKAKAHAAVRLVEMSLEEFREKRRLAGELDPEVPD